MNLNNKHPIHRSCNPILSLFYIFIRISDASHKAKKKIMKKMKKMKKIITMKNSKISERLNFLGESNGKYTV